MRLPTLNVDVKVNTSTMKKDIERANKQLQGIGGKAAAFAGGGFGKVGALGSLGGTAGSLAIGAAGLGFAAAAPGMVAEKILGSFNATMEEARKNLEEFAKSGHTSTMTMAQAMELVANAAPRPEEIKRPGFFGGLARGFTAGAQEGGLGGFLTDWSENTAKGLSWLGTLLGGTVAGIGGGATADQIIAQADLAIASSEQEARQLYSREENARRDREFSKFQKQMRETTT